MAEESADQRAARLEHLSALQQQYLALETPEERAARLEHKIALQWQKRKACHAVWQDEAHLPLLERKLFKGSVAHGVSRSIKFSQCFFCCFIVFLYMSAGCVSTFRSCMQGYLEWLPFIFASHLHFTLC